MRIAIVSDYFPPVSPGGAELSALHLALALHPHVNMEVVTTDFGARPDLPFPVHYLKLSGITADASAVEDPRQLFEGGVRPFSRSVHYPQFARTLASLARAREFDLIHTQQLGSEVAAYLSRPLHRLPRVTTVRGYRHLASSWQDEAAVQHGVAVGGSGAGILSRIKHHVPKAAVRSGAHVFTVSEFVRNAYVEHGMASPNSSSSVFNIMPEVEPTESDVAEARKLVDDIEGPVILFAGRLTKGKGLGMLIDAMPHVLRQVPETTLLVVGGGDETAFRSQAAANLVSYGVRFTGHLSNGVTRALLNRASAVAMPSLHHEPLARVLLEAIAVGVPVVATPYGGTPEVIEDDQNGLLVDPVGAESLARSLLIAITDEGLRDRSRQFDSELRAGRLNPVRTIDATIGVYEKALAA